MRQLKWEYTKKKRRRDITAWLGDTHAHWGPAFSFFSCQFCWRNFIFSNHIEQNFLSKSPNFFFGISKTTIQTLGYSNLFRITGTQNSENAYCATYLTRKISRNEKYSNSLNGYGSSSVDLRAQFLRWISFFSILMFARASLTGLNQIPGDWKTPFIKSKNGLRKARTRKNPRSCSPLGVFRSISLIFSGFFFDFDFASPYLCSFFLKLNW